MTHHFNACHLSFAHPGVHKCCSTSVKQGRSGLCYPILCVKRLRNACHLSIACPGVHSRCSTGIEQSSFGLCYTTICVKRLRYGLVDMVQETSLGNRL